MPNLTPQASDKLFKQAMSDREVAMEVSRQHLPPEVYQHIIWPTFWLGKETGIDDQQDVLAADVVYKAKTKSGNDFYLILLCEHQSTVDKSMAFRLLRYSVQLMKNHRDQHPNAPLPWVYPLVLYAGENRWTAPRDIFPLFGKQAELVRRYWTRYQLIDICRVDDNDLSKWKLARVFQYALKYRKAKAIRKYLKVIFQWLSQLEDRGKMDYAKTTLKYIIRTYALTTIC